MKKITNILEQRIYLFYFLLSLILVLIIISVEWQLVRYGIKLTENQKIGYIFDRFQNQSQEIYNTKISNLEIIADFLQKDNGLILANIQSILNVLGNEIDKKQLFIIDKDGKIIIGEKWDLIKRLSIKVKTMMSERKEGYIITVYGNRPYIAIYKAIFDKNQNYLGMIVNIENFIYSIPFMGETQFKIFSCPFKKSLFPKEALPYFDIINHVCKKNNGNQPIRKIIRVSYSLAIGIYSNSVQSSLFLVFYRRNINIFAQQSIWFFILILISITLIMIAVFGNWFKKAILHPVKIVSDTMKQNSEYPVQLHKINLDYGGVLGEMIASFNQMEDALEKYSNYLLEYKIATENIENGVFWLDDNFKILMYNRSFLKILEIDDSIKGKKLLDIIKLDKESIKKIKEDSLYIKNYEYKTKSTQKHLNINFKLVKEKDKSIIVGAITDITQITLEKIAREKLELELIKSNKLAEIGRRIEGVIHNMNSPLNSIIGYAQLMRKDIGENEDLEKILKSGKLIAHYIKTLQQKIKNDNMSMYHPIDINKLLKAELELFKNNLFFKHHVKTITRFYRNLPKLTAVYGDVSMCITNIINNALESMENSEEKLLTITTEYKDNSIFISISDTGCGIPKEELSNIFEPYYSTKSYPKGSGYGLGLAIAKYIIEKYKGKILVESELGKGSTFILIFPVANREA